jgi:hypothetical protein
LKDPLKPGKWKKLNSVYITDRLNRRGGAREFGGDRGGFAFAAVEAVQQLKLLDGFNNNGALRHGIMEEFT